MVKTNKFTTTDNVENDQEKGIFEVTKTSGGKHSTQGGPALAMATQNQCLLMHAKIGQSRTYHTSISSS